MAKLGFEPATSGSAVRCITNCAMEPGITDLHVDTCNRIIWMNLIS